MSTPLAEEILTVKWQMEDPAVQPSEWRSWSEIQPVPRHPLETKLGWPTGTLSILEQAFRLQLPRSLGWDLSGLANQDPYRQAARIFRRGVAVLPPSPIQAQEGHYPIHLSHKWDWKQILPRTSFALIDEHVAAAWKIVEDEQIVVLRLEESSKNLESVAQLLNLMRDRQAAFPGPCTIIGGGVLADTAAFAAALLGLAFRLVPTTLLAMLDACIGGKTGVNFPPFGKNQLGLFAFPSEVLISSAWLQTLPQREFLAGLNEGYKHALLLGDPELAAAVTHLEQRPQHLGLYLKKLVQVKSEIVAKDPNERNVRVALNLGHTLAHALERVSHARRPAHPLLHGEAVGVGLLFCIELSHKLAYLNQASYLTMRSHLLQSRLVLKPKQLLKYLGYADLANDELIEELLIGIKQDKKARSQDGSEWVLLQDWGKIVEHSSRYTVSIFDDDFRNFYRGFVSQWT